MTQTRRTTLTQIAYLATCMTMDCTQVQAGFRTFTFNEIQDFWRVVKGGEYRTVEELRLAVQDRFGSLPIKFFGLDSRTNEVRGVEILSIIPYADATEERLNDMSDRAYEDGALIEYNIYAGADHIPLSRRHSYFPVTLLR